MPTASLAEEAADCDGANGPQSDSACAVQVIPMQTPRRSRSSTTHKTRDIIGYIDTGVGGAAALLGVYLLISGDNPTATIERRKTTR